jgi:hypothetical protein
MIESKRDGAAELAESGRRAVEARELIIWLDKILDAARTALAQRIAATETTP